MDSLNSLHGLLAKYFKEYLTDAMNEGEEVPPGVIANILTFLKNNNITVDMLETDDMMDFGLELREMARLNKGAIY